MSSRRSYRIPSFDNEEQDVCGWLASANRRDTFQSLLQAVHRATVMTSNTAKVQSLK